MSLHHIRRKADVMEVLVGPLPDSDDRDARFDVLLHSQDGDGRFVALERSLGDFLTLSRALGAGERQWEKLLPLPVDGPRSLLTGVARRQRLRFALEEFLRGALDDASNSPSLLRFVAADVFAFPFHDEELVGMRAKYQQAIEEVLAGLGAPQSPTDCHETSLKQDRDEWISAGCSFEHEIAVPGSENDPGAVVVWKFESQREDLKFAVHFSSDDRGVASSSSDPYAAGADSFEESGSTVPWEVVQHWSTIHFTKELNDTSQNSMYGHFTSSMPGILRLSWENADMNCVLSKQLRFQIGVLKPVVGASSSLLLNTLLAKVTTGIIAAEAGNWLQTYSTASAQSRQVSSEELPGWCTNEDGQSERNSLFSDDGGQREGNFNCKCAGEIEQKAFQVRQLEAQVDELMKSLADSKQELRVARDQAEIANEIYKASLEMITQLEHEAVVNKRDQEADNAIRHERKTEQVPASPSDSATSVDPSEHERVKALCASFQEQCLWRSVESAECEKRNLLLDVKLAAALEENDTTTEQLQSTTLELDALRVETQKLKAHRAVLVQEVKRLQPFSQVNLAALIQEAQEARMMQRSLQAQLDKFQCPKSTDPLEEHVRNPGDDIALPEDFVVVSEPSII